MRRLAPLLTALVLAACGGASTGGGATGASEQAATGLPAVQVVDLGSQGGRTDLATLRADGKPLLVWFWAPY